VALLGETVVENLFGGIDPSIRSSGSRKYLPCGGVMAEKGKTRWVRTRMMSFSCPSPRSEEAFRYGVPGMVRQIMVKAKSTEELGPAEKEVTELLRQSTIRAQRKMTTFP